MSAPARVGPGGPPSEVVLASSNEKKLGEVRAILEPRGIRVRSLVEAAADAGVELPAEPVEDAPDFLGNARIKARAYARALGVECLADDSGLVVDALDGAPGVRSARYAGVDGARALRDGANNDLLLRNLDGVPPERRTARFVCAMCLAAPSGAIVVEAEGVFEGRIAAAPRGDGGFGYDPLVELPDLAGTPLAHADGTPPTLAELRADEKHARSHRGKALQALVAALG